MSEFEVGDVVQVVNTDRMCSEKHEIEPSDDTWLENMIDSLALVTEVIEEGSALDCYDVEVTFSYKNRSINYTWCVHDHNLSYIGKL